MAEAQTIGLTNREGKHAGICELHKTCASPALVQPSSHLFPCERFEIWRVYVEASGRQQCPHMRRDKLLIEFGFD